MKWDCEIIGDLIPSYVDEVCSEKSRAAVEEHIGECAACKKLLEQQKLTDFSAGKLEERELNGLKKIRSRMKRQTMISCGLAALLLVLGCNSYMGDAYLPRIIYYILMMVCMFGAYRTGDGEAAQVRAGRADGWFTLGSVALIAVAVAILQIALAQVFAGEDVLGVSPEHAGPRMALIWAVCFLAEFAILGVLWYRQHKLHVENRFRLCICITGIFLLLVYVEALRNLDDASVIIQTYIRMSVAVLVLGAAGTVLNWYLPRRRRGTK